MARLTARVVALGLHGRATSADSDRHWYPRSAEAAILRGADD
jgi:hypothetical protein